MRFNSIKKTRDRFIPLFTKLTKLKELGVRPNKDLNKKIFKDTKENEK